MEIKASPNGSRTGRKATNWKGGRKIVSDYYMTYIRIYKPEHPRANHQGYVLEHILVLENSFGRPILASESVHHIDGDGTNNNISNLMVFKTHAMHRDYHTRLKAFNKCGHYNWLPCKYCHQYDNPANLTIITNQRKGGNKYQVYHSGCRNIYQRKLRAGLIKPRKLRFSTEELEELSELL
jgi:hypothetical protein